MPGDAPSASDLELLQGIASGSEEAFGVFYHRWSPRLGPFLLRATGSREVAEDLLQEAFLRMLRAAPSYEPRGSVRAWIYRICTNLAYSHWRRIRRSPFREGDPHAQEDRLVDTRAATPESVRARSAFREELTAALSELPPNQRIVFILKADRGLTYQEIAEVLRCPEGTAKSRFHHAVRRLRAELSSWSSGLRSWGADDAAAVFLRRSQS